jgi:hypothetical protein
MQMQTQRGDKEKQEMDVKERRDEIVLMKVMMRREWMREMKEWVWMREMMMVEDVMRMNELIESTMRRERSERNLNFCL